jgi:hypothetical protein
MCPQRIVLGAAPYAGNVVGDDLFAANTLFSSNYLDAGGAYDRMLQELGWTGLRFPGGTITEQMFAPGAAFVERFFDVTRPNGLSTDGSARIVTAPAAFRYATERDLTFHFTLPTKNYYTDVVNSDGIRIPSQFGLYQIFAKTDNIIRGDYGDINVTSFEIGNEFWYAGLNPIDPREYGIIVDRVSSGLQALFDSYQAERGGPTEWTQPLIAAQAGTSWLPEANSQIFPQLTLDGREALDAVIQHYYPDSYTRAGTRLRTFDRMDEWREQEGIRDDIEYFVSEWNMFNNSELGLTQTSGMLEMMRTMVLRDVDYAAVWGTQYFSLGSRLAALRNDPTAPGGLEYTLTPAGEIFRMMSENLRGLQVIDIDTPASMRQFIATPQAERPANGAEQLVMHAYGNADTRIIFISSRSDIPIDVSVDPGALVSGYHHVWGELLGVLDNPATTSVNEGDYTSRFALPYIRTFNQASLTGSQGLNFTLQPYEVMKLEFTIGDVGVSMAGQDYMADPAANFTDDLNGTNFDDVIYGGAGNDILRGNAGNDTLIGGPGNDFLGGWTGDDLLDGGAGNNTLRGGDGNDILIARDGINLLRGEADRDQFIVSVLGQNTIVDFDLDGGEGLSFFKHYEDMSDVLDRTERDGNDLLITHEGGGFTRLVGLGPRLGDFSAALTDFQPDSPVSDLVDLLNTPPPDGSILPDPELVATAPPLIPQDEIFAFLRLENAAEVAAYIRDLTPEEETYFLTQINSNALALSATQQLWGAFCNNLSEEGFRRFIDAADPDILDMRYARIGAEQFRTGFETTLGEDRLPLCRTLFEITDEVRIDFFLLFTETQKAEIETIWANNRPDQAGLTAEEIYRVSEEEVETRRLELLTTDETPLLARFMLPGEYDKAYLARAEDDDEDEVDGGTGGNDGSTGGTDGGTGENTGGNSGNTDNDDDDDDEDDEDDASGSRGGGGCFIATCAYGDYDHPDVMYLRLFRDLVLSDYAAGRRFIRVYYRYGPYLAKAIGPFPMLRAAVRAVLSRAVRAMQSRHLGNRHPF